MADNKKNDGITNAELVADDPGLTSPPTGIVLEREKTVTSKIVQDAEEAIQEKDKK